MAWRTWAGWATAAVLAAVVGCGPARLNTEKSFSVGGGGEPAQVWLLDPQAAEQTLKVDVTSDAPVDVFVLVGIDESTAFGLTNDELKQKAVASRADARQDAITAKIPARQAPVVVVRYNSQREKASGKVKLTN